MINAVRLLPELKRRGHEVHVLIAWKGNRGPQPNIDILRGYGVKCHLIEYPKYTEDFVKWIILIIKDIAPDVFVPNVFVQGCLASKWVKRAGIPVINTLRSDDLFNMERAKFFATCPTDFRYTGLVSVSNYLDKKLKQTTPTLYQIPTKIIPSGVEIYQERKKEGLPFKVAYSGRLIQEQKRFDDLFRIFIDIAKSDRDIEFHIFGNGDHDEIPFYKKETTKHGLEKKIIFHGTLRAPTYHDKLSQCHLVVLFSKYEGMPGALMDGMACGLVPISTWFGGIEELIEDGKNGFVISEDPNDLMEKIRQIKEDQSLRKTLSAKARETIVKRFSLQVAADRWEEFFKEQLQLFPRKSPIKVPKSIRLPKKSNLLTADKRKPSLFFRLKKSVHKRVIQILQF